MFVTAEKNIYILEFEYRIAKKKNKETISADTPIVPCISTALKGCERQKRGTKDGYKKRDGRRRPRRLATGGTA